MSTSSSFYLARAEACANEAEEAVLENVRERCLRAEAAWRAMADRTLRAQAMRDEREAEKPSDDSAVAL